MKYLAAYALLALSGNNNISTFLRNIGAADIKRVLGDAQIKADDADINRLLESVKGKPIHQLIAEGTKQIGSSGPAPVASSAPKATEVKKEAPKQVKKEAKKEAPPPEDDEDMMAGGLFD